MRAAAVRVLTEAEPEAKCSAAEAAAALAKTADFAFAAKDDPAPPDRPARPQRPPLVSPAKVARRRLGALDGRIALLHAIAHIEFNAIDLAFDMIARFGPEIRERGLDTVQFCADWGKVGADEARHFGMINNRLHALGARYGDLPAHDGLWEAASATAASLAGRLVVAPLILEARGLDVTPSMIQKLRRAGDVESADLLDVIYEEEIGHVAAGTRWFHAICKDEGAEPEATFRVLQQDFFPAGPKPPFNHGARDLAGMPRGFYEPTLGKFPLN